MKKYRVKSDKPIFRPAPGSIIYARLNRSGKNSAFVKVKASGRKYVCGVIMDSEEDHVRALIGNEVRMETSWYEFFPATIEESGNE